MTKFYGPIGFVELKETSPGVWTPKVTERNYYGDFIKQGRNLQSANRVNDSITISESLSIVADPYALNHYHTMAYIVRGPAKWKIDSVVENYPKLELTLGGLYNEQPIESA